MGNLISPGVIAARDPGLREIVDQPGITNLLLSIEETESPTVQQTLLTGLAQSIAPNDQSPTLKEWSKVERLLNAAGISDQVTGMLGKLVGRPTMSAQELGVLVGACIHDANNKLSAMMGYGELIGQVRPGVPLSESQVGYLKMTKKATLGIKSIIDETQTVADAGRERPLKRSVVHLAQLGNEVVGEKIPGQVKMNVIGNSAEVDPMAASRILGNLVKNAVEAMPPDKAEDLELQIKLLSDQAKGLIITVEDNGPGIPAEIKDKLFQLGATCGKFKGSGFGLWNTMKLAEQHGGTATCNTSNKGTRFMVTLPGPKENAA